MPIKTPFYDKHVELGGKVIDFHGWYLSMQFTGIPDEHRAVRESVGIFDVSHMGNVIIKGPNAKEFLNSVLTNSIYKIDVNQLKYCHILRPDGSIIDDTICARVGEEEFYLVPNATMIGPVFEWYKDHAPEGVELENVSDKTGIIALQGPKAKKVLKKITDDDTSDWDFFQCRWLKLNGMDEPTLVWHSGYTGEDGFELMLPESYAASIWDALWEAGQEYNIKAIGLGARDTLRMEKGFLLSGQDFGGPDSGPRTTLETGGSGGFALKMDHDFIGKKALEKQQEEGLTDMFVGITTIERGIPREGYPILKDGKKVGVITSGTMVPTTKKGWGLGYVPIELSEIGTELEIEIRGKPVKAVVAKP